MNTDPVCPFGICDGYKKIRYEGKYYDCPCKKFEIKKEAFQNACRPVGFSKYTSEKFEALKPYGKSLYFLGNEIQIWSMIFGELEKEYDQKDGQFTFLYSDTYEMSSSYSGNNDSLDVHKYLDVDLVIFHLTNLTWSEKMNQIVQWLYQIRFSHGKPIWFVAADKTLVKTYSAELIAALTKLPTIQIKDYQPSLKVVGVPQASVAPVQATPSPATPVPVTAPANDADDPIPWTEEKVLEEALETPVQFREQHKFIPEDEYQEEKKKKRGRPPGSKNKPKSAPLDNVLGPANGNS